MKNLKYSMRARILAVLLAIVFGLLTTTGCFTTLFTYEMGLYNHSLSSVVQSHQTELQRYYSTKIFTEMKKGNVKDAVKDCGMEYGILHADSIDNINLEDTSQYLYHNFSNSQPQKDSYTVSFNQTASSTRCGDAPTLLDTLTDHLDYKIGKGKVEEKYEQIKRIVYAADTGEFYFETASHSFPIEEIFVDGDFLVADGLDDKYISSSKDISTEELADINTFSYNSTTHKYVSTSQMYQPLKAADYASWGTFGVPYDLYDDGYTENFFFKAEEIEKATTDELLPAATDGMYLFETDGTNTVFHKKTYPMISYTTEVANDGDIYWIISNVTNPSGNSLFAKQESALTFLYDSRNINIVLTFLFCICFLLMTAFCCYTAGSREDHTPVTIRFYHRIPLLLYLAGAALCEGALASAKVMLYRTLFFNSKNAFPCIFFNIICTIAAILIFLLAAVNISIRIKGNIFKRYTVCHYIAKGIAFIWSRYIRRPFHSLGYICRTHISLTFKCILMFGMISLIDIVFAMILINAGSLILCFLWLFIKLIELAVIIFAAYQMTLLQTQSREMALGNLDTALDTSHMLWEFKKHGDYLNQIGDGLSIALKERLKSEHFKTELITNVSHDIKTPLTSIINYVDLLQKEPASSETVKEYLEVLERQSTRLKKLIEDLIEASKASTGNLSVNLESCDISILLTQTVGEFEEKLEANDLELITQNPNSSVVVQADNRHLWRIFDNLMNNICKYAQPGTRVYINLETDEKSVRIIFRNTSKYALNISSEELTERFVRGDASRNTEGNGLGLSIAQSLAELMHGSLKIIIDGDLFKAVVTLPLD